MDVKGQFGLVRGFKRLRSTYALPSVAVLLH